MYELLCRESRLIMSWQCDRLGTGSVDYLPATAEIRADGGSLSSGTWNKCSLSMYYFLNHILMPLVYHKLYTMSLHNLYTILLHCTARLPPIFFRIRTYLCVTRMRYRCCTSPRWGSTAGFRLLLSMTLRRITGNILDSYANFIVH